MLIKFNIDFADNQKVLFRRGEIVEAFACEQIISKWYLLYAPHASDLLGPGAFDIQNSNMLYFKGREHDYIGKPYIWVDSSYVEVCKEAELTSNHQAKSLLSLRPAGY